MRNVPNVALKVVLMKKGLTQRALAFGSGVDEGRISKIIKGYERPTREVKKAIADFLEIKEQDLFAA
jgi:transcriptional regulator with XRE-family HTH domain